MPEQAARFSDPGEYLIFRQLTCDVAAIRAGKLRFAVDRQRFVIAITGTCPFCETSLTVFAVLYRLIAQIVQHRQIKPVAFTLRLGLTVEEGFRPCVLLGEDFVTSRDVTIGREGK